MHGTAASPSFAEQRSHPSPHSSHSIQDDLAMACQYNDQLRGNLARVMDDLNPLRVRQLFTNIPQAVSRLGGFGERNVWVWVWRLGVEDGSLQ